MIGRSLYCKFTKGSLRETLCVLLALLFGLPAYAQHAKRELAVSIASAGQYPIATKGDARSGFFREPFIFNLRYQVATDYITSASLFIESLAETRERRDLWSDDPSSTTGAYNADISEHLTMTLVGVEAARTLVRTGDFRLALTLAAGYGLGSATAEVQPVTGTGPKRTFESCDIWHGVYLAGSFRGRYTIYQSDTYDIGITASLRTWGFPTIGSFGDCVTSYNGPAFTSLFEIGYLAGLSIGFL